MRSCSIGHSAILVAPARIKRQRPMHSHHFVANLHRGTASCRSPRPGFCQRLCPFQSVDCSLALLALACILTSQSGHHVWLYLAIMTRTGLTARATGYLHSILFALAACTHFSCRFPCASCPLRHVSPPIAMGLVEKVHTVRPFAKQRPIIATDCYSPQTRRLF